MWNPPDPEYFAKAWLIARQIPRGKVSTYGQIASMIPAPPDGDPEQYRRLGARWVGAAMHDIPDGDIPWQRVINSQGKISLSGSSGDRQRELLRREGVQFSEDGAVDLERYGWDGPDESWLDEHDFLPPNLFTKKPRQKPLF
jgi:methylated-DNA-protein-cysteine methyltransferase-like protein